MKLNEIVVGKVYYYRFGGVVQKGTCITLTGNTVVMEDSQFKYAPLMVEITPDKVISEVVGTVPSKDNSIGYGFIFFMLFLIFIMCLMR